MSNLKAEFESTVSTWRLMNVENLQELFVGSGQMSAEYFRTLLYRLNKSARIFCFRHNGRNLVFDKSWKARWDYLQRFHEQKRDKVLNRSGMQHHLELVDVGVRFRNWFPEFETDPVFNVEHGMGRKNPLGPTQPYSPDLISVRKGATSLIYIEYERTPKSPSRYLDRWACYEGDPSVELCLYIVPSRKLEVRISNYLRNYFRRTYSSSSFRVAVLHLEECRPQGQCQVFWTNTEERMSLKGLFRGGSSE